MEPTIQQSDRNLLNTNLATTAHRESNLSVTLNRLSSILRVDKQSILPAELSIKRDAVLVMPDLEVQTHSRVDMQSTIQAQKGRDRKEIFDVLVEPFALSPEMPLDGTSLLYVDKMRPHAKFDMMVTQADANIAPRFEDLSLKARERVVENIVDFMSFCRTAGLTAICSYSIDPLTLDRKSAQSSKRFHVHFVGREKREVERVIQEAKPLASLDNFARRRLVDETAIVLGMALGDRLNQLNLDNNFQIVKPFSGNGDYPFLTLLVKKPDTLREAHSLARTLSLVHTTYDSMYSDLKQDFFEGENSHWQRARKSGSDFSEPAASDRYFTEETSRAIRHVVGSFSSKALDLLEMTKPDDSHRALVSHVYPNACPAYSVTLSNQVAGEIAITFRPFLFSDTGGAGLSSLNDIVIKTRKADEVRMSSVEMRERMEFQQEALAHMGVNQ